MKLTDDVKAQTHEHTEFRVITVRLGTKTRELLGRLEKIYGGKRQAIEMALYELDYKLTVDADEAARARCMAREANDGVGL